MANINSDHSIENAALFSPKGQLIVNIVEKISRDDPKRVYCELPVSPTSYDDGVRSVTYEQFANSVNGLAWWLTSQLGKSTCFQTLMYNGPNDFRQNAMILASTKCGYKLLLASPRNQLSSLRSLICSLDPKAILSADLDSAFATRIQKARPIPELLVPGVEEILSQSFPVYAYNKTFEEAKMDPILILHTSGTTNMPKPITYTNDYVSACTHSLNLESPPGTENMDTVCENKRFFVMMPPFHAGNLLPTFFYGLTHRTTIIFPPAHLPTTVEVFLDTIQNTLVDVAFIPPHFPQQITRNAEYLEIVRRQVKTIMSGGGHVPKKAGDILSLQVQLSIKYASTELGSIPCTLIKGSLPSDNWSYINPHPAAGLSFQLHSTDKYGKVYEARIVRTQNAAEQPIFKLFTELDEFRTRDLFREHPELPNMWQWCGRADNTIVLATGANVSPEIMEEGIAESPDISGVLMVGNTRIRPAILIEHKSEKVSSKELLKRIWKTIDNLNSEYFEDFRILKSHVLFTKGESPMCRSLKGTVQRQATIDLYAEELDCLYSNSS
ncbi:hypothetical protein BJ875DRAFT_480250 [Amylocarpus encephaloides]|uniref:AMP-dependent synthetase/ligase domain-containing protein n=1 Tax=Amylocarpus encephaloides TaxID=45428 RepID=A0A9P7YRQ7_9HELO|nr:hypothetical protein BJ875DRAFT_480250 [Amylocarpus encephaloides]